MSRFLLSIAARLVLFYSIKTAQLIGDILSPTHSNKILVLRHYYGVTKL